MRHGYDPLHALPFFQAFSDAMHLLTTATFLYAGTELSAYGLAAADGFEKDE